MKTYIVAFNSDCGIEGFKCKADNKAHAKEQCKNAYPDAVILRTQERTRKITDDKHEEEQS